MRRSLKIAAPLLASVALLLSTSMAVDLDGLALAFEQVRYPWLLAALGLSIPQMAAMALRWQFTVRRIGGSLRYGRALLDYYLSTLLNGVLPGGIAGDVVRALRHRGALRDEEAKVVRGVGSASLGVAVRAVMLERLAGQLVLWMLMVCSLASWSRAISLDATKLITMAVLVVAAIVLALQHPRIRHGAIGRALAVFARDGKTALVHRGAWAVQLVTSAVALLCTAGMFYCCARALDLELPLGTLVRTVPLLLGASSLPISFSGWGVREATAAALWSAEGLTPADGVAVSMLFGLTALIGSVPGVLALFVRRAPPVPLPTE